LGRETLEGKEAMTVTEDAVREELKKVFDPNCL